MGCFVLLFALISPRLAIILTWLFSGVLERAYDGWLVPGARVLPAAVDDARLRVDVRRGPGPQVDGFEWILVGVAVLIDLGSLLGGGRSRRD